MNDKTSTAVPDGVTIHTGANSVDFQKAFNGSYYFIAGAGGELSEWITGYSDIMRKEGIGVPTEWFSVLGGDVNKFGRLKKGGELRDSDEFPHDLRCLLFPLDGLDIGKLAIFKLRMEDRWFDDVIQNMRTR